MNEKTNESVEIKSELNETPKPGLEFDEYWIQETLDNLTATKVSAWDATVNPQILRETRVINYQAYQQSLKFLESALAEIKRLKSWDHFIGTLRVLTDFKELDENGKQTILLIMDGLKYRENSK